MANLSATVEKELKKKFHEYCKSNGLNSSQIIEKLIKRFLKKNSTKKLDFS